MPKKIFRRSQETFTNPYYFIPLEKECKKENNFRKIINRIDLITGWINCELTTLTPIFIPNTTNDQTFSFPEHIIEKEFKSHDFYSYKQFEENEQDPEEPIPVIPSSELRGMTGVSFEALTNSCLSTVDKKQILYKRTPTVGKPARIFKSNGGWKLQDCDLIGINTLGGNRDINPPFPQIHEEYTEGQKIFFRRNGEYIKFIKNRPISLYDTVGEISHVINNRCKEIGYLHLGEPFSRKHHEKVFKPIIKEENAIDLPNANETIKRFRENVRIYQNSDSNSYKGIDLDAKEYLIYYQIHNNRYYLSPAAIGREVFYNTIPKILENRNYHSCQTIDSICPACLLFGFTSDHKNREKNALASRIRFTDALISREAKEGYFFKKGILKELASPKPSAVEFYLKKPKTSNGSKVDIWNYDYAGSWRRQNDGSYKVVWGSKKPYSPLICGRKFYWHQKILNENKLPYIKKGESTKRKVGIRPLKPNICFDFKIFFNNITENELKKLIWVLEIGNHEKNAHKIGMGKPLGLGSVRISIKNIKVREISLKDKDIDYNIKDYNVEEVLNPKELLGCSQEILDLYLKNTNFENSPNNVEYPNNVNGEHHFEWFMVNREISPGTTFRWVFDQSLCEEKSQLFKYEEVPDTKTKNAQYKTKAKKSKINPNALNLTHKGYVKFFTGKFGFIKYKFESEEYEIYVPLREIIPNEQNVKILKEGDEVEFKIGKGRQDYEAKEVRLI